MCIESDIHMYGQILFITSICLTLLLLLLFIVIEYTHPPLSEHNSALPISEVFR